MPVSNKYLLRELALKGQKYGAGYSRILNKLAPENLDLLSTGGSLTHRGLTTAISNQTITLKDLS